MKDPIHYFVYIKDILGVETNMDSFSWSYGTVAPEASKEAFDRCRIKLSIERCADRAVFPESWDGKQKGFSCFAEGSEKNTVYYEKNFVFGKKLRYIISVDGNHVSVRVGKSYLRFIPLRIMNLHAMHYVLSDLVSGLLLMNGIASMYCSAVHFPEHNRCALIFSPPGMGKSVTALLLCRQHGAKFLAEDITVTDGETVWAVPWTSSYRADAGQTGSGMKRLRNRIGKLVPILDKRQKISVQALLGEEGLAENAGATDLVLLEHGASGISKEKGDAQRRLLLLNRYLFNYHKSPCMIALSYFYPEFSPEQMYLMEKGILERLLQNSGFFYVSEENPPAYSDSLFRELIGE